MKRSLRGQYVGAEKESAEKMLVFDDSFLKFGYFERRRKQKSEKTKLCGLMDTPTI